LTGTGKNGARRESDVATIGWVGLRLLLEKSPAILWTTDRELRVSRSLGAGLSALGLRSGDGEGVTIYEFFGNRSESYPPIAAHVAALRGEARDLEYRWNGRLFGLHIEPLRDEEGHGVGVVGVGFDLTDRRTSERAFKQLEGELLDARKDSSLHTLLRLRLTELSDVLSTVVGTAERAGTDGPGTRSEAIDQILRVAERGADMLRELHEALGEKHSEKKPEASPAVPDSEGGETILLVDDEPQVRGFVRRALEEHGYRVLETSAVDEALALGASYPGRIHLLLTDVVLPGMSGPQLAARLAPLRPEMRILYMTGYADDAIVHRGVISAGQALLVKPFTSLGLAHEVKKALRN
jgi:CheY-like chemotaxis protein